VLASTVGVDVEGGRQVIFSWRIATVITAKGLDVLSTHLVAVKCLAILEGTYCIVDLTVCWGLPKKRVGRKLLQFIQYSGVNSGWFVQYLLKVLCQ
jgi:hypothetical protein